MDRMLPSELIIWDQTLKVCCQYLALRYDLANIRFVLFIAELFDQDQEPSCCTLTSNSQCCGICNQADLVLDTELVSLFTKQFQSCRRVIGAVKAYLIAVELVKRLIHVTERVFFDGQGFRGGSRCFWICLQT